MIDRSRDLFSRDDVHAVVSKLLEANIGCCINKTDDGWTVHTTYVKDFSFLDSIVDNLTPPETDLRAEVLTKYLKSNGCTCPFCDRADLEAAYSDAENDHLGNLRIPVVCRNCGRKWLDMLRLFGMAPDNGKDHT